MGTEGLIRKLEVFSELPPCWKCCLCNQVMLHPIQTFRGESACEDCYAKAKGNSLNCPIDHLPIENQKVYFKDRAKEREIYSLETPCVNKHQGCEWRGSVKEFKEHALMCTYKEEDCPNCEKPVGPSNEIQHFHECIELPEGSKCIFKDVGCKEKVLSKNKMQTHLNKEMNYHLYLTMREIQSVTKANESLKIENQNKNQQINRLQNKVDELSSTVEALKSHFNSELANIKSQFIAQLQADGAASSNEKKPVDNSDNNRESGERAAINDLDLRLQLHENSTSDGNLTWKIDNFEKRKLQAIQGKVKALHSAPCFVAQHSYKYCLRLFLNGQGDGYGSHLSLFLVIMRSEYDNILEWPFNKKVTFTLINQENQHLSIVEKMIPNQSTSFQKPDVNKDRNAGSGIPKFVRIDQLVSNGFLKDDCLFIKVKIE